MKHVGGMKTLQWIVQFWTSPWAWVMLCHHPRLSHSVLQVHQWMTYTQSCLSHCNFISTTLAALDYPFPEQYNTFYRLQIVSAWRQSMLFDLWTSDCSPLQPSLQSALDSARGEGHVVFVVLNCWTVWLYQTLSLSLAPVQPPLSMFCYHYCLDIFVSSAWTADEAVIQMGECVTTNLASIPIKFVDRMYLFTLVQRNLLMQLNNVRYVKLNCCAICKLVWKKITRLFF